MKNERKSPLLRRSMAPDPIEQFIRWLKEAEQAEMNQPNAMTLATSDRQGKPSARIVLLRGVDERGFVFFTNYESRKGQEIWENPYAALVFSWQKLARQVRVEGPVEFLEPKESDLYFAGRPRGHQIQSYASPQSKVIEGRTMLEKQYAIMASTFEGKVVPRPPYWGGYRVVPDSMEFWQEGDSRLHDRLRYRRSSGGDWVIDRLAP